MAFLCEHAIAGDFAQADGIFNVTSLFAAEVWFVEWDHLRLII